MSLKHGLLGLLNYGSMSGYDLNTAFKYSLAFFWKAQTSQIYRELDKMEQTGWLTSEHIIQKDKPNRRVYTITEEGKKELVNWLSDSSKKDIVEMASIRSTFLMKIFFAGEISDEQAIASLNNFRQECIHSINYLNSIEKPVQEYTNNVKSDKKTKYWKMVNMFADYYYQAELDWADKTIKLLEEEQYEK